MLNVNRYIVVQLFTLPTKLQEIFINVVLSQFFCIFVATYDLCMDKKRIIIVGPAYPYRGGIADFNERLAREFQREGHEVLT